jgi:hypothetical protein
MRASGWLTIGGVWLGLVLLWLRLRPTQFGHAWHATGRTRFVVLFIIVALGLLQQVFVFGCLIPIGIGIYKFVRK